jgi:hypothetical protein
VWYLIKYRSNFTLLLFLMSSSSSSSSFAATVWPNPRLYTALFVLTSNLEQISFRIWLYIKYLHFGISVGYLQNVSAHKTIRRPESWMSWNESPALGAQETRSGSHLLQPFGTTSAK